MILVGGKKNGNYITDDELKIIYQECINREKNSLQKSILKSNNKSFLYDKKKSLTCKDCNNILNLQNQALNNFKLKNIETKKMIERLLKYTSKTKDNLLLNQVNNYRIKKENNLKINQIIK